jgi:hypothetical protein
MSYYRFEVQNGPDKWTQVKYVDYDRRKAERLAIKYSKQFSGVSLRISERRRYTQTVDPQYAYYVGGAKVDAPAPYEPFEAFIHEWLGEDIFDDYRKGTYNDPVSLDMHKAKQGRYAEGIFRVTYQDGSVSYYQGAVAKARREISAEAFAEMVERDKKIKAERRERDRHKLASNLKNPQQRMKILGAGTRFSPFGGVLEHSDTVALWEKLNALAYELENLPGGEFKAVCAAIRAGVETDDLEEMDTPEEDEATTDPYSPAPNPDWVCNRLPDGWTGGPTTTLSFVKAFRAYHHCELREAVNTWNHLQAHRSETSEANQS